MGYIKEPYGITFVVDKKKLTNEVENRIRNFIEISKSKNIEFLRQKKID